MSYHAIRMLRRNLTIAYGFRIHFVALFLYRYQKLVNDQSLYIVFYYGSLIRVKRNLHVKLPNVIILSPEALF